MESINSIPSIVIGVTDQTAMTATIMMHRHGATADYSNRDACASHYSPAHDSFLFTRSSAASSLKDTFAIRLHHDPATVFGRCWFSG